MKIYNKKRTWIIGIVVTVLISLPIIYCVRAYCADTVTVNREMDYRYYVKDYTNQYNSYSKALSLSGATVSVYCGAQLLETYSVPLNKTGTVWNAFEIIDGELVDINQIR